MNLRLTDPFPQDGFISLDEMSTYLTSVFKVLFKVSPATANKLNVSAENLGEATARAAFEQADLNHDNRLSFAEFERWYRQSAVQA